MLIVHRRKAENRSLSLSATVLRRRIFSALKSDNSTVHVAESINQNTVYAHPTVHGLSTFLASSVKPPSGNGTDGIAANDPTIPIENMIKKYSQGLDDEIHGTEPLPSAHRVLLTGSTGNLGSQILESLLRDSNVEKIYALNRPSSQGALARHEQRFEDKGFDVELLRQDKLRLLEGDASDLKLGLADDVYQEVCAFGLVAFRKLTSLFLTDYAQCHRHHPQRMAFELQSILTFF